MRILIAPDKFKHSLSAEQVCEIIAKRLKQKSKNIEIELLPLADGGEGSAKLIANQQNAKKIDIEVHDPLSRIIEAHYFISNQTAFIEMAVASGLQLLKAEEQNVKKTNTYGTGELILDAIKRGSKHIILCIGGSATSEGGVGMASAIGFKFFDHFGHEFIPSAENLDNIKSIAKPENDLLEGIQFDVLTDVNNPLMGENGAVFQYALQKGASPEELQQLDKGMHHLHALILKQFNFDIDTKAGAGAAGGLGGGATFFLNAHLHSGIDYIAELTQLDEKVKWADLIITGEGKLDEQSFKGKVVSGVQKSCKKFNKECLLLVGYNALSEIENLPVVYSLTEIAGNQNEAIKNPQEYLKRAVDLMIKEQDLFNEK
ncbi:glycerate kinase [Marivirga arenosa]|uniref:Glycerate kinase n=1 Tax=Marivirga arenosa TaxID=3059076 RepID=A0AA51N8I2_9BACT|nr:glycerate kinase [Marivirga sp. ABR2-2]WMN08028.1 glycerate kinase [Marivirga sp. ABR2-2]